MTPGARRGPLRLLLVEDSDDDARLVVRTVSRAGWDVDHDRVCARDDLAARLGDAWDAVICDHGLPGFDSLSALACVREADPDLPFIIVSGSITEDAVVEAMNAGAGDYVTKHNLDRLVPALDRELSKTRERALRRRAEQEARRLAAIVESSSDAIVATDLDLRVASWNAAAARTFGWPAEEIVGHSMLEIVPPSERQALAHLAAVAASGSAVTEQETVHVHRDGSVIDVSLTLSPIRDEDGAIDGIAVISRDIGERKRLQRQLQHLVDHDPLTGLLNRRRFAEELERLIAESRRYGISGALLLLDLDGLKAVNDQLGHAQGDKLLCGIADLMRCRMRRTDVVGRLGGDEFALLLPHTDRATAEGLAGELQHRIRQSAPMLLGGAPNRLSASVGIALVTPEVEWTGAEDALQEADGALYVAKNEGRDCVRVATPPVRREGSRLRTSWSDRILAALREDRFELYAQPIVGICGDDRPRHELLLRLHGESGEMLRPGSFVPDAERSELIYDIDRWVIWRSAELLAAWRRARGEVHLHVNLSSQTITSDNAAPLIAEALAHAGIGGEGLVYEITETTAISSIDRAQRFAAAVRRLGCGLALDDFGSGFASFTYLKHLDYDFVKLDGGLVRDVTCNTRDQRILACIADLARGMGKRAIAEFVQDEATVDLLRELGVDYAQGYHLGEPVPVRLDASVTPPIVTG